MGLVPGDLGLFTATVETVQPRHEKRFALNISFLVKGFFSSAFQDGKAKSAQADLHWNNCWVTASTSSQSRLSQRQVWFCWGSLFWFWKDMLCPWDFFLLDNQHLGRCHRFHQCRSPLCLFFLDWTPSPQDQHGVSWSFQMKLGKWAGWLASALRCTKRPCREGAFARRSNKCNFLHELAVPHWLQRGRRENKKRATVC